MWFLMISMTFAQIQPGPIDAFRANYASTKVTLDFDYVEGTLKDEGGKPWLGQKPEFVAIPKTRIIGRWKCDGVAEYFRFSSTDEILELASKGKLQIESGKVQYSVPFVPKSEAIWDGEVVCSHLDDPHKKRSGGDPEWKMISTHVAGDEVGILHPGRGPYHWGFCLFPNVLKRFRNVEPSVHRVTRWGIPTDVEVYHQAASADDWEQIEISYDPSIGYLPRLFRSLAYGKESDELSVREIYLTDSWLCSGGGFVPTEWYEMIYHIKDFRSKYPDYSTKTMFEPSPSTVGASHFRASNVQNFAGPVALTELAGVHSIVGIGGRVPFSNKGSLNFKEIRTSMGNRLTMPQTRFLPNLDQDEIHELETTSSSFGLSTLIGVLSLVGVISVIGRVRRGRFWPVWMVFVVVGLSSGCGVTSEPIIKLTTAFERPLEYLETSSNEVSTKLILRNDGNINVRLLKKSMEDVLAARSTG